VASIRINKCIPDFGGGKLKERHHFEELDVDGRITLNESYRSRMGGRGQI
jgi:hypothetical protein